MRVTWHGPLFLMRWHVYRAALAVVVVLLHAAPSHAEQDCTATARYPDGTEVKRCDGLSARTPPAHDVCERS